LDGWMVVCSKQVALLLVAVVVVCLFFFGGLLAISSNQFLRLLYPPNSPITKQSLQSIHPDHSLLLSLLAGHYQHQLLT